MNTFKCIKCGVDYKSNDADAHYCEECLKTKNKIAIEIDKKFANRPKKTIKSDNQILEETGQLVIAQGAVIKMGKPQAPQQ